MPITSVDKDPVALTLTVTAEFPVPVQRLWDAYADPRQIEKFWGPPQWPATFFRHDMFPGGYTNYAMTGPDGETAPGYWEFLSVNAPHSFEVLDGFSHEDGSPNREMPSMRMVFKFEPTDDGSRLMTTTYFNTVAEMEQLAEMGMEEGMRSAMGQIDDVLDDLRSFARGNGTELKLLNDTQVRITRVIRGSVEQVWEAHNNADLMKRWMLGPEGWSMPVCELATKVGETHTQMWESEIDGTSFGFTGKLLESEAPFRLVTTEEMVGMEGPSTLNEMTLTPLDEGTLLSLVITYPDKELRDQVLESSMVDGMETSYARLEHEVFATA